MPNYPYHPNGIRIFFPNADPSFSKIMSMKILNDFLKIIYAYYTYALLGYKLLRTESKLTRQYNNSVKVRNSLTSCNNGVGADCYFFYLFYAKFVLN